MKAIGVHPVVDQAAGTVRAGSRVQGVSGGSADPEEGGTAMLAWMGGSLVATIVALLLLTVLIGDLRVESAFERTLKPAPASTGSSGEGGPTQG